MEEDLNQLEKNQVWNLVPIQNDYPIIRTKWVFRKKMNEVGKVVS